VLGDRLLDEIERAVVGKRSQLRLVLAGLLAGGHVLLDDVPGVAKTLAARSLATAAGLDFARVQFTPDVLPSDITGHTALDLRTNDPIFRRGPIFAQLVLADEINRAPAKTQAALLEAMQEGRVTIEGTTYRLPSPFLVIATQNPVESEGTYPLPEAQLDRFILRTSIGYPSAAHERELLHRRIERATDEPTLSPVLDARTFLGLQQAAERVQVHPAIVDYVVAIVHASRSNRDLALGSSPRGSLALVKVSRSLAMLNGRDFVTPDDVRQIALPALAHRVVLTDEAWARGTPADVVVQAVVDSVPAPTWQ
jgi:MoxR-like ATPase